MKATNQNETKTEMKTTTPEQQAYLAARAALRQAQGMLCDARDQATRDARLEVCRRAQLDVSIAQLSFDKARQSNPAAAN